MNTKFKKGDYVRILNHQNSKNIGRIGEISEVIPVFETKEGAYEANYIGKHAIKDCKSDTTGFYKVKCDGKNIRYCATDDCIERVND